jgi:Flp pilus assembly CpaE family ATPase
MRIDRGPFDEMMSADPLFSEVIMVATRQRAHDLREAGYSLEETDSEDGRGLLVTFHSASGGAGTSTLAANFARKVADLSDRRVLLIDGDLSAGVLHHLVGERRATSLGRWGDEDGGDTDGPPEDMLPLGRNLDLLPVPASTELADGISPERVAATLETLRARYEYLVVDTPSRIDARVREMIVPADRLFLLVRNELVGVRSAQHRLDELWRAGLERERVRLVLNAADPKGAPEEHVAMALDAEIGVRIAADPRAVFEAQADQKLLVEASPRARAAVDIMSAARSFLVPHERVLPEKEASAGFSLWSLFGR